jgi:hypothetical protein
MDAAGEAVEWEVTAALPCPFKFRRINKIVICLGPEANEKDSQESLGVGLKECRISMSTRTLTRARPKKSLRCRATWS